MRKMVLKYSAPTEGHGFSGTKTHEVRGEEVLTGEDGEFTYIRSFGPKPLNQPGQPKSAPVSEDFRVITGRVISVHESEVTE